jgi:hypothetical protein
MSFKEKSLYHQIHPAKLFTDWFTGLLSLYFIWRHELLIGLVVGIIPSILASFFIMQFANIEHLKQSRFGKYIEKYMTKQMQIVRFVGYFIMVLSAWWHNIFFIVIGLIIILSAWFRGKWRR